jgi:hypothetical protein
MTPKEKAKELVDKYADNLPRIWYNVVESKNYHSARQCALIAVDEIISIVPYENYNRDTLCPYDFADLSREYWQDVKQEIEKL